MDSLVHVISVAAFVGFVVWEFRVKDPLVNLRILKSRNFRTGLMLMTVIGIILYGTTAELPLFLQTLMGYPALQSGYTMSPRGVAACSPRFWWGGWSGKFRCAGCWDSGFRC
jgi:DHA2 family multidrug resistance protein